MTYGISSVRTYAERYMEPLFPISDSYLQSFELVTDFPPGVTMDVQTGVISGMPDAVEKQRKYQIEIVGINSFGKVSTSFTLIVLPDRKTKNGISVCSIPVPPNTLSLTPELFTTAAPLHCWEQSDFSWTSENTSLNLHYVTHLEAVYSFPHAFILKTMVATTMYLDGYKHPLLQTEASSQMVTYKVTIKLASGLHRLDLFANSVNAEGKGYFSLFYAITASPEPQLLTYENAVLPVMAPRFATIEDAIGFDGVPLDLPVQSSWPLKTLIRGEDPSIPSSLTSSSPMALRDIDPVCGDYNAFAVLVTDYGDRTVYFQYQVEPPRESVLVTVYEEGEERERMKKQVYEMESFDPA